MLSRTIPAVLACFAGAAGLGWLLMSMFSAVLAPGFASALLVAPVPLLLFAAVAEGICPPAPQPSRRWQWWLTDAPLVAWPVMLPLALLGLTGWESASLPPSARVLLRAAPFVLSAVAFSFSRPAVAPEPARRVATSELVLLAFTLAAAAVCVMSSARAQTIADNDGGYYFGLARHMATTWRFEEPIVWHFLHVPDALIHPPFDYWAPMTVGLLVPSMAIFGATKATAFVTMGVVSAATLVLFWYLVCVAMPLRHFATRLTGVVLFACSERMGVWRYQPESVVPVHVWLLLALVFYYRGRFVTSVLCGAGIFLARTDGLVLFALLVLANAHAAWKLGGRQALRVVFAAAGFAVAYMAWSFLSFGTPTPPAPGKLVMLPEYVEVYTYGVERQLTLAPLVERFDFGYLVARLELALASIRRIPFIVSQDAWLVLALFGGVRFLRVRTNPGAFVWVLFFAGFSLHVWLAGESFAPWRAPYGYFPLLVLVGMFGMDEICDWLAGWSRRAERWRFRPLHLVVATTLVVSLVYGFAGRSGFPSGLIPNAFSLGTRRDLQQQFMERVDSLVKGAAVASNSPWWVMAYTTSPVVSVPYNGAEAIEAVLRKYAIEYLVLWGNPIADVRHPSRGVFEKAASQERTVLGSLVLELQSGFRGGNVWRVTTPPPN